MIETEMAARHEGQVGEDVIFGNGDLAVLHILGMHEFDGAENTQLLKQDGAD